GIVAGLENTADLQKNLLGAAQVQIGVADGNERYAVAGSYAEEPSKLSAEHDRTRFAGNAPALHERVQRASSQVPNRRSGVDSAQVDSLKIREIALNQGLRVEEGLR